MLPEFKGVERLLRAAAYRYHKRCIGAGAHSVTLDDVFQETCVAFCHARDHYQPETIGPNGEVKHVPFPAFLRLGIQHHLNRWIGKEIMQVQDRLELDASYSDVEGETTAHDFLPDTKAVNAEAVAVEQAAIKSFEAKLLDAHARQFLEILRDPPPALLEAVHALNARRKFAIERGLSSPPVVRHVQACMVFDLMGISSRFTRCRIYERIKTLITKRTGIVL